MRTLVKSLLIEKYQICRTAIVDFLQALLLTVSYATIFIF